MGKKRKKGLKWKKEAGADSDFQWKKGYFQWKKAKKGLKLAIGGQNLSKILIGGGFGGRF